MRTPAGAECKYYYEDFHRRSFQECRLIARNPDSAAWSAGLCGRCPVPGILQSNACIHLLLKATVAREWLIQKRVKVEAYCEQQLVGVASPHSGCGHCAHLQSVADRKP
ncbi:MAG: hypothetical protein HY259_10775 [Chloroflexi bacterium]|nr:hypothetical protein [Chloroflexota bacterium]MBI3733922.1 hypothetical protein [Chloroflexota bacterium]